jgi:hypothetical protein
MAYIAQPYGLTGTGAPGQTKLRSKIQIAPVKNPYDAIIQNARASMISPQQQRTASNQQVNAQINAQLGASRASSTAEQQQYAALQNRAAGLAAALGAMAPGQQQGVYNAYADAAKTVGSLGTGLTGAVASDWGAANNQAQQAVQQYLGGVGAPAASYDLPALQSTGQMLGVTMPASTLATTALNQRALEGYDIGAQKAQAATKVQDYLQQAQDALNQRAAERATIIAQRPELYQTALTAQQARADTAQNRLDTMVGNSLSYLQNQRKLVDAEKQQAFNQGHVKKVDALNKRSADLAEKAQAVQTAHIHLTDRLNTMNTTHIDPKTGLPLANYQFDPTDPTHKRIITSAQALAIKTETANEAIARHVDPKTGLPIAGWQIDPDDPTGKRVITNSQALANKQEAAAEKHADVTDWLNKVNITHRDPDTGLPVGEWMNDPSDKTGVRMIRTTDYINNKHWFDTFKENKRQFNVTAKINQQKVKQLAVNANALGTYNEGLSKQAGILVDGKGHPFKKVGGGTIPYTPTAGSTKTPRYDDQLSKQVGYLVDADRNPILDSNKNRIKYKDRAKLGGGSGAFSQSLLGDASTLADDAYTVKPDSTVSNGLGGINSLPGTGHPRESYRDALAKVFARGPATRAWAVKAKQIVDARYGMGEGVGTSGQEGRPYEGSDRITWANRELNKQLKKGATAQEAFTTLANTGLIDLPTLLKLTKKKYKTVADFGAAMSPLAQKPWNTVGVE